MDHGKLPKGMTENTLKLYPWSVCGIGSVFFLLTFLIGGILLIPKLIRSDVCVIYALIPIAIWLLWGFFGIWLLMDAGHVVIFSREGIYREDKIRRKSLFTPWSEIGYMYEVKDYGNKYIYLLFSSSEMDEQRLQGLYSRENFINPNRVIVPTFVLSDDYKRIKEYIHNMGIDEQIVITKGPIRYRRLWR